MNKNEFINKLNNKLSNFPETEVLDRISFYTEMIDDYVDEGMSEEEAILKLGSIDEIVESIAHEIPLSKIAKKKLKSRRKLNTLEIVLLIVGFPLWFSLLAGGISVILALYAAIWTVVICLWAIVVSCGVTAFASVILFIVYVCSGEPSLGFGLFAAALVLLGVAMLFIIASKYLTDITIKLPKMLFRWIKSLFIIKEDVNNEEIC